MSAKQELLPAALIGVLGALSSSLTQSVIDEQALRRFLQRLRQSASLKYYGQALDELLASLDRIESAIDSRNRKLDIAASAASTAQDAGVSSVPALHKLLDAAVRRGALDQFSAVCLKRDLTRSHQQHVSSPDIQDPACAALNSLDWLRQLFNPDIEFLVNANAATSSSPEDVQVIRAILNVRGITNEVSVELVFDLQQSLSSSTEEDGQDDIVDVSFQGLHTSQGMTSADLMSCSYIADSTWAASTGHWSSRILSVYEAMSGYMATAAAASRGHEATVGSGAGQGSGFSLHLPRDRTHFNFLEPWASAAPLSKVSAKMLTNAVQECVDAVLRHTTDHNGNARFEMARAEAILTPATVSQLRQVADAMADTTREPDFNPRRVVMDGSLRKELLQLSRAQRRVGDIHRRMPPESELGRVEEQFLRPMVAFHATSHPDATQSVLESGLLQPGEIDARGRMLRMRHGAAFGQGLYVSPSLALASSYAHVDAMQHFEVFACIVFPGWCRFWTKELADLVWDNEHLSFRDMNCDSHTTPDKKQLVLYQSEHAVPVLRLTLRFPSGDDALCASVPLSGMSGWTAAQPEEEGGSARQSGSKKSTSSSQQRSDSGCVYAYLITAGTRALEALKRPNTAARTKISCKSSRRDEEGKEEGDGSTSAQGTANKDWKRPSVTTDQMLEMEHWLLVVPRRLVSAAPAMAMNSQSSVGTVLYFVADISGLDGKDTVKQMDEAMVTTCNTFWNSLHPSRMHLLTLRDNNIEESLVRDQASIPGTLLSQRGKTTAAAVAALADTTGSKPWRLLDAVVEAVTKEEDEAKERQSKRFLQLAEEVVSAVVSEQEGLEQHWPSAVVHSVQRLHDSLSGPDHSPSHTRSDQNTDGQISSIHREKLVARALDLLRQANTTRPRHVIVFLTNKTEKSPLLDDKSERRLDQAHKRVAGCGCETSVKVVALGKRTEPSLYLRFKLALETLSSMAESSPFLLCQRLASLPSVVDKLCFELRHSMHAQLAQLFVPVYEHSSFMGFVEDVSAVPKQSRIAAWSTSPRQSEQACVLYRGRTPSEVLVNGLSFPVQPVISDFAISFATSDEGKQKANRLLLSQLTKIQASNAKSKPRPRPKDETVIQNQVEDVKNDNAKTKCIQTLSLQQALTAALTPMFDRLCMRVAGGDFDVALSVELLEQIIKALPTSSLSVVPFLSQMESASAALQAVRQQKTNMAMLQSSANRVKEFAVVRKTESRADKLAPWLSRIADFKFGRAIAKRVKPAADVDIESMVQQAERIGGLAERDAHFEEAFSLTSLKEDVETFSIWTSASSFVEGGKRTLGADVTALLSVLPMPGIMLQVQRSEASNIDPWLLKIPYVSCDWTLTSRLVIALDAGIPVQDSASKSVNDVVVPQLPVIGGCFMVDETVSFMIRSHIHRCLLALTFTRNPEAVVPGQRLALVSIALCRSVTQLMSEDYRSVEHAITSIMLLMTLRHELETFRAKNDDGEPVPILERWESLLDKLAQPLPGRYMTEAEGDSVSSVSMLLAALMAAVDRAFSKRLLGPCQTKANADAKVNTLQIKTKSEVAIALLQECVSRACRMEMHRKKMAIAKERRVPPRLRPFLSSSSTAMTDSDLSHALLCDTLGITLETCHDVRPDDEPEPSDLHHSRSFDERKAKLHSGWHFGQTWTNTAPQAVVACLHFAEVLADSLQQRNATSLHELFKEWSVPSSCQTAAESIVRSFSGLHMGSFLEKYLPESPSKKSHLQIALYVQGLRYFNSKTRRAGVPPFSDPLKTIEATAQLCRQRVYGDRVVAKLQRLRAREHGQRRATKHAIALERQRLFMMSHSGVPVLLSPAELSAINADRAQSDQIVLGETGLPLHACAHPDCDKYLVNLDTQTDRLLGRRRGLFKHLAPTMYPEPVHIPRLHKALQIVRRRHRGLSSSEELAKALRAELVTGREKLPNSFPRIAKAAWEQYFGTK